MNKLHFKVGLFAAASLVLAAVFIVYLLHARGFFEKTFHLQLAAASADGVAPGVPVVFSGIEIGRVTTLGLNENGGIIIHTEFLSRNAKWLKENSSFTLDKPIVGGAKIRVDSPDLRAPALPDNATMLLLTSDISKEIPALVERVKAILANVEYLTRKDGEINATLANVKTVTGRMTGEYGVLEGVLGSPEKARAVTDSLDKTRALIAKLDAMTAKTDQWLFAQDGMAEQTKASLAQVRLMLNDAQSSLKKADAVMANAVEISANVKDGTQDIAKLRAEIDDAVRKANGLINEINKKWPFAREPEVKLP
ncbi:MULTISPECIES: MlaD family protein [unclassified Thiobacillus]|uniref:MlaD family protein n=1 Tax=unclassified Thiobacillus TaxID=2646513 RepID=UPI00086D7C15|nr:MULTISPECIES: MlaD family protein [unclassified Thiobacillus]MBD3810758.1 MCE family protein [Betaproteobacteria bacterium]MBS0311879.1 MCE family protein [Pseudomonadota bacterium]ODU99982.1 MAG: ABC transporter substrate-binding protein [Thiobacillus sp. SCN 63-57]OJY54960.1 MAG: ABC transporter substrate-binding protein [Thiobacillus sp. 0-1251]TXH73478.1 MAG: MCE family protein [Thiobacillus sp.]